MNAQRVMFAGARVVDGDHDEIGDVLVADGRIVRTGRDLEAGVAANEPDVRIVDARGRLLVPGFIDMHAHSGITLFGEPELTAKISSGYTTDLICPDGLGAAPVRPAAVADRRQYLAALETGEAPWDWESFGDYLRAIGQAGPAVNIAACVPHSAVRDYVMGGAARAADAREVREIAALAAECLDQGGHAISFGLIYAPGLYAERDELMALGEVAAGYGVPLVPHIRNEADMVLDSVREFVDISRRTGARVHLSHLKIIGNAHLLEDLHDLIQRSGDDVDLTFDQYPYGAGSTLLSALLPKHFFEGGAPKMMARLSDPHERRRMAREMRDGLPGWENIYGNVGPENIDITQTSPVHADLVGMTVAAISEHRGTSPEDTIFDLLLDCRLNVGMIDHYSAESVVRSIFSIPRGMVGTDGVFNEHPHPRLYGTSARVLGRYSLRENLVSTQEAVARLSTRPADCLGLSDRGRIAEGKRADLVLIDPEAFIDSATYASPTTAPEGIDLVMVNGTVALGEGADGTHSGQVLDRAVAAH
ncbi:MAG: amidohydrolase family protein [Microbacterium sp.]